MHVLILVTLLAATSFEFLVSKGLLPSVMKFVPELLAMLAFTYVLVAGVQNRFKFVHAAYWMVFSAMLLVIACGAIVNAVDPGVIFAGVRKYLRAIPLFLLPAVLLVRERNLQAQLTLLFAICLAQLPIAWQQRSATMADAARRQLVYASGDPTFGTIMNSGWLTLFLVSAACVLTAFYLRGRISFWRYLMLVVVFLLPTTLNQSKATLLIAPLALMVTWYVGSAAGTRLRNTVLASLVVAAFIAIFVPIYDYYQKPKWGYGILDFYTMEGRLETYLIKGTEVGIQGEAGRIGGMIIAANYISRDPVTLMFGLGIANSTDSALGEQFSGAYQHLFLHLRLNSFSNFLLDFGLLGVTLILILHLLILRDSWAVARLDSGLAGVLALGWIGVNLTQVFGLVYHTASGASAIEFPFWLLSGVLAAHRMRLAWAKRETASKAAPGMSPQPG